MGKCADVQISNGFGFNIKSKAIRMFVNRYWLTNTLKSNATLRNHSYPVYIIIRYINLASIKINRQIEW